MFGIGPAVDSAAFSVLRATLGSLVAQGSLDKFIVLGYGFEGGFSACAELSRFKDDEELKTIERQLRSIRPNPRTTSYSIQTVPACP
jgi:hypothetical protein